MQQSRRRWTPTQREQFWRAVRGRIAELRLDQQQVADELGLHSSNLSRRLQGRVQDPPNERMLEVLLTILQLDGKRATALRNLANGNTQSPATWPAMSVDVLKNESADTADQELTIDDAPDDSGKRVPVAARPNHRRRPLIAITALLALTGLVVAMRTHVGPATPTARISQPRDGSAEPVGWIDASGSTHDMLSSGPERLWLVEEQAGYYWPQQQAIVRNDIWVAQVRLGASAADVGKRLDVLLVLAPAAADQDFRVWLDQGATRGDYPPLRGLPAGASILDRVTVSIAAD